MSHPIAPLIQSVEAEFAQLDELIIDRVASRVGMAEEISTYLVNAGGKRVRPLVTLLALKALNASSNTGVLLAASIEFLHTATLLHDDVVDESEQRRGKATANQKWGNAPSVLAGDFVYTRAFQLMVEVGDMRILQELADTTNRIAEGELQQLINKGDADLDRDRYFDVIYAKTARLFEAAGRVAGLLAGATDEQTHALGEYGRLVGLAFQIADDALDFNPSAKTGKNPGDDLAEGKVTLPVIIGYERLDKADVRWLKIQYTRANADEIDGVIERLTACDAFEASWQTAEGFAQQAIDAISVLPANAFRDHLESLARLSARRTT